MEDQSQQLKDLLEAEKQEFLAVMSHELRTPMTGVKGYLSMILDGDAGEISSDIREYIAAAYVANDRLIRLVDRMMKTVAVNEGKIKLNIKKVNLNENLELLSHDFTYPAKEKKLALTYQKPKEIIYVLADPDKMREVIMNLISNALKFTEKGEIVISCRTSNHSAVIDVKDTGVGIKKENQGKLFGIFTKENLALAGQEKGTGLGLFLAKRLAEAQNGQVWLEESEEGKGSTFSASFPLA
jgi:signal transduction histidine kinase